MMGVGEGAESRQGGGRSVGRVGTCGDVSGTGIFFSTKLTLPGCRSSSFITFWWDQATWAQGRGQGYHQAGRKLKQTSAPALPALKSWL